MSRFWQELKSVLQAAKLLNSLATRVRVLRDKKEVELERKEVVPGDVLVLTGILRSSFYFYVILTMRVRRRRFSWRFCPLYVREFNGCASLVDGRDDPS